ncbi:xanthine dehydrogenase small subunit [Enterobacter hormaechei]|nr:xanthine dehydrogenase small subunit [Enterobacter hormaechei]
MTQFLLNQQQVTIDDVDPNLTVLNWLRHDRQRCGTKEGCASGDCGACTVVIGQPDNGKMRYQSANSCLLLVGQLHGKQLLTVEDLAKGDALHWVQQKLVCSHASQCGFCTPGIVMSMFAMYKSGATADQAVVSRHLGGNLCRCTGYRPIAEAAIQILRERADDSFSQHENETAQRLTALAHGPFINDALLMPETLDALATSYEQHPQALLLAGGTDLNLRLTQGFLPHERLISLAGVSELRGVQRVGHRLDIGAMTTLDECQHTLREAIPAFTEMLDRFASQQIRNLGTLGGNIANASPIGDCAPALLALDARLRLRCGAQTRELALQDFFLGYRRTALAPGEFITHILIDDVTLSRNLHLWKVSKRREDDISTVFAAINIDAENGRITRARIAFGGIAATPVRAYGCETSLLGKPLTPNTFTAVGQELEAEFKPLTDVRASAAYRLQVAKNLLRRYALARTTSHAVEISDYVP